MQPLVNEDVIRSFACYTGPIEDGFLIDFLGTRTRIDFLAGMADWKPVVEGYPFPVSFHATLLEWAGSLRSVLEARGRFVMAECGAGWAPWLVSMHAAARQRGIGETLLIGVEGSKAHCDFSRTHFLDNGLDPDAHKLIHGVVGTRDGHAQFPILDDPELDYGSAAVFAQRPIRSVGERLREMAKTLLGRGRPARRVERVPCFSLKTLLAGQPRVDLLHIDIQGHEYEVIDSSCALLTRQVRRMVIGTHGRVIEERLMQRLSALGWVLEGEESCQFTQHGRTMALSRDGTQVWVNPAVAVSERQAA
jgi:FkbM family methyltransferase